MSFFLDEVVVLLCSGPGGAGCLSFRRERYLPRGGPDGGDGGRGGDLYLVARTYLSTLDSLRGQRHFRGGKGQPGSSRKCHGKSGRDLYVEVPVGTIIRDFERGHVLAELVKPDEPLLFLKGGKGGRGNHSFRSAKRQTPRIAQKGQPALERKVKFELKLLADVGLVGLPNAGKSTLLSRLTAAKPKVGAYAFTTLSPKVGVIEYDFETLTIADLPGLLEGAHEGRGLGDRFLRHIERTRILVHLVDGAEGDAERLAADYEVVQRELASYGDRLADKPAIVVLTKSDARDGDIPREEFERLTGASVLVISAVDDTGIESLIKQLFRLARPPAPRSSESHS